MYKSTKQTGPEQSRDFADSILITRRQTKAYFRLGQIMSLFELQLPNQSDSRIHYYNVIAYI